MRIIRLDCQAAQDSLAKKFATLILNVLMIPPPFHAVWENTQYLYYTMKSGACQFLTPELTQYINISIKI